ncbi:hypothetical protein NLU13_7209 [Sarocladium strictum]|uniref:Exocyst complex component Sec3 PIP2-binding N-terminal domain-containing protein n=1 Tax=Sarocladium strictum TaxID=5046 RepID=A0AA39GCX4_SARSR|nr:hypothetical protein NLU13_7209 [Sarocladium strictum]
MNPANGAGPASAANRAERFEDEKRRIVDSCFYKKDTDGSLLETYVTHIRITEFSSYPMSPPPPEARSPQSEKPRVIIVAFRRSGRVRLHKSKENPNGTFSIGKTWDLNDLTSIESYTGPDVSPNHKEWAGDTGFLVSLGKPYYWQAQADKEKKFFIASLVKIYGKYTGGKVPDLIGFDQKELDLVMGAGRRQPSGSAPPPPRPPGSSGSIASSAPPPGPDSLRQQAALPPSAVPSPGVADAPRGPRPPAVRALPNGSPSGSFDSTASRERPLRKMAQDNKSQDSVATSFANRSDDGSSIPPRSRNGMAGPGAFARFGDSRETLEPLSQPPREPLPPTPQTLASPIQSLPQEQAPPERKRPPMDPTRPMDRDLVPKPLMSPSAKRDPIAPPPRNSDRPSSRKDLGSMRSIPDMPPSRDGPGQATPPPFMARLEERMLESTQPDPQAQLKRPSVVSLPPTGAPQSASEAPVETPAAIPQPPPEPVEEEEARPGLGPMIKSKKSKGDIAGAFWKAANAANAFKPRPGGAGERLRQLQNKMSVEGPDGITGVVPAPPRPATPEKPKDETPQPSAPGTPNKRESQAKAGVPEVKITVPGSSRPSSVQGPSQPAAKAEKDKSEEEPQRSVISGNDSKYLQSLGINPSVLDERSQNFTHWLDYFGWVPGERMRAHTLDEMKIDLDREINKAQAGGWLARFEEEDERVGAIKSGIDLAITECEELDNLLTLYSVELSTLSDDIAYIEAQGQGLQVQTANQKLLKQELEALLETCAITEQDLQALRFAPLDNMRGLEDLENTLVILFKAMSKIDPSLGGGSPAKAGDATLEADQPSGLNSDYGNMRIVREKQQMYLQESNIFMQRLLDFMARQFDAAFAETRRSMEGALSKKVDATHHDAGRELLWKYSPLMLYARDVDLENWNHMIQVYQDKGHPLYQGEFQTVINLWRKNARKLNGDEAELLFSHQAEKQQEGVASTARKLTVKRSQTLARALRSPLADGQSRTNVDKSTSDTRSHPYEVFAGVLHDLLPLVQMEQNFIVDFFHASTLEHIDFTDVVSACPPRDRRGGDLKRQRLMEPDRELARRVTRSMEVIFSFFEAELLRLMEWVIAQDPLQGVGVLAIIEKTQSDMGQSNMDYLNTLFQKLHDNLEIRFKKFVDEQIRAIEETKVKINKRKGVISFVRIFPGFSAAVENMLVGVGLDPNLPLRRTIDREYERVLKSMFDSLKVIARENPAVGVTNGSADPEDKEALNFHILLIENMNHFLEEVDTKGLDLLEEWKDQANNEYHEHMDLYVNAVVRRPLGKLLDHLENIEAQLQSGRSPASIAAQPSNTKHIFNKVLGNYDSKEVRKGIEALRKRVEKHFGDADDPNLSRGLVGKVLTECEAFYGDVEGRIGRVTTDVYGGDVLFEWPRADVKAAFR